jgi:hypothetical protein
VSDRQERNEVPPHSKTLAVDAEDLSYRTVEQRNGRASMIRFELKNPEVKPGDVLVVLSGSDILFHGLIMSVDEGWATTRDRNSLLLPDTVH